MAYPPPVPPATRTDATVMATSHPTDHNTISAALTEILNHIAAMETALGNPWRQPASGAATFNPIVVGPDGGATLTITGVSGNLFVANGPGTAIIITRNAMISGWAKISHNQILASGTLKLTVGVNGAVGPVMEMPTLDSRFGTLIVPIVAYVANNAVIDFSAFRAGAALPLSGGSFQLFETGTFGGSVKT